MGRWKPWEWHCNPPPPSEGGTQQSFIQATFFPGSLLFLPPGAGRGETLGTRLLYREALPWGPNPYPFIYYFLTEKVPLSYTFHRKLYPFHIPTEWVLPSGSSPGVLYGLPKVHKAGCPFCPIVSSVNTYNYNLVSYLVSVLQPISTNQHSVKESFNFADWAKKYKHNNRIMCSLDVCLLFTNVPLDETIDIALDKLYSLSDPPTLPHAVLQKLLEFATKKSHFLFDGQYYDQIDGVAMGSPLGPVLANIFVCHWRKMGHERSSLSFILVQVRWWHFHHVWKQRHC